jgi:hypothetical protein
MYDFYPVKEDSKREDNIDSKAKVGNKQQQVNHSFMD